MISSYDVRVIEQLQKATIVTDKITADTKISELYTQEFVEVCVDMGIHLENILDFTVNEDSTIRDVINFLMCFDNYGDK